MKILLFLLLIIPYAQAQFIDKIKNLILLETLIKAEHFECFDEKDTTEIYRKYRIFFENKIDEIKTIKLSSKDEKNLTILASECLKKCSCSSLLEVADHKYLTNKSKSKILDYVSVAASEIKGSDYKHCLQKTKKPCSSIIVKEFNLFKAD